MSGDKQTIIDLETRFWQSMVDKDAKLAKSMIAQECLITGPMGAMKIDPDRYEAMTEEGRWTLQSFKLSDVDVIMPTDEVAVIAYTVHQKGDMKGKPMDMTCADSTTWVRDGQSWKCALHTETMLQNA
ncbi:nuclear transport factor 2 family protein [Bosea sp. 2KB_26]|uniref:nuclear transport factor 2 family protein n=1 Tax=Bosea sp. 2KB_26 TaxID=3237475 RepID=UPI0013B03587